MATVRRETYYADGPPDAEGRTHYTMKAPLGGSLYAFLTSVLAACGLVALCLQFTSSVFAYIVAATVGFVAMEFLEGKYGGRTYTMRIGIKLPEAAEGTKTPEAQCG